MNSQRTPVTILVPVFNASEHIKAGLGSILDMARDIDEVLIIDDGSEDDSIEQVRLFSRSFSNVNFIPRKHFGLVETLNFGIRESANTFVARADIDDLYSSARIEKQLNVMLSSPNLSAVFSDYSFISNNDEDLGTLPSAIRPELVHLSLANHQRTPHSSVMFNRDFVLEAGGYMPNDYPAEDLGLWMRLARFSQLSSLPDVLLKYRINPSGITETSRDLMKMKTTIFRKSLLNDLKLETIISNLPNFLEAYSDMPLQGTRRTLVFRDLTTLIQLQENSRIRFVQGVAEISSYFDISEIALSAIKLARDQRKRKAYRSIGY